MKTIVVLVFGSARRKFSAKSDVTGQTDCSLQDKRERDKGVKIMILRSSRFHLDIAIGLQLSDH